MASTGKVLGAIGALHTLIDNFPMSILDLLKGGKTYTSSFEFIMDVLYACGVPNDEIIGFLLEEIYSITPDIENGIEGLKEDIASMDFSKVQQSPFLQHLEEGIKIILNGLFAFCVMAIICPVPLLSPSQKQITASATFIISSFLI